ncbi:tail completion protein gp17 [Maritalea mediterranea]|uniref:DUF3168 domain-containing protein n=1 Tax=Maritalea mediterranea TaxID=2909667 RepID=A0ABS9E8Z9_9HYPH|nr:DUF3168 domain-containing protein [Maritalea mediterranea]MCF4097936.1 DUF3168 domain-containing protein [Maritalea mediterranea]
MADFALELQTELVTLLASDPTLTNLIGSGKIVDAPRRGQRPPFIIIKSHQYSPRDAIASSLFDHEIELEFWHARSARQLGFQVAERVVELFLTHDFGSSFRAVRQNHRHTKTSIEPRTGWVKTLIGLRITLEPLS